VVTEEVLDTGRAVQVAERLELDNPDWVIMYGSYTREFVAFPVYPDAPDNSYCSAKDPAALDDHIREAERRHGRVRLTGRPAVRVIRAAAGSPSGQAAAARRLRVRSRPALGPLTSISPAGSRTQRRDLRYG
jgi:hypothetical protein